MTVNILQPLCQFAYLVGNYPSSVAYGFTDSTFLLHEIIFQSIDLISNYIIFKWDARGKSSGRRSGAAIRIEGLNIFYNRFPEQEEKDEPQQNTIR